MEVAVAWEFGIVKKILQNPKPNPKKKKKGNILVFQSMRLNLTSSQKYITGRALGCTQSMIKSKLMDDNLYLPS